MKRSTKIIMTSLFIAPLVVGIVIAMVSLAVEYRWFVRENKGGDVSDVNSLTDSIPKPHDKKLQSIETNNLSTIIRELVAISDANTLRAKLDEYNKRGILAIGGREDFDNPDGFFVFVVGETRAYGTFLFHDNDFWNLQTNIRLADLPEQLRDKQQIWVIEADKLVEH